MTPPENKISTSESWYLYVLECNDCTLYTGITNDVNSRLLAHNSGKGAKYTRGRIPVTLKASMKYENKSEAAKAEYAFKKLSKKQKLAIICEVASL